MEFRSLPPRARLTVSHLAETVVWTGGMEGDKTVTWSSREHIQKQPFVSERKPAMNSTETQ